MKFSVLMSLYIKEEPSYLNQCLESIYLQSLQAEEIIIVLDGPITNELNKVIKIWSSKLPITTVTLKNNLGLGRALSIGLENCKNDIVFRMDTDDICNKNRFETQIQYLKKHSDVDILGCHIEEFSSKPNDIRRIRNTPKKVNHNKDILIRNPINHMGVVYKKSKIMKAGSYQPLESMEDYYLWLRAYSLGFKIHNCSEVLVHARIGNGMLERRKGLKYISSEWKLHKIKRSLFPETPKSYLLLIFISRATLRFFPTALLKSLYSLTRRNLPKEKIKCNSSDPT